MEVSALKSNVEMKIPFVQLGDIISLSKGKKHEPIGNGKNRYINIENLHNSANSLFTNEEGTFVVEDDLIIAWDGANAGKVGVGFVGVIGSTLARMRIKSPDVSPRYLFWYLESINESIKSQRTGATIPHVNGNSLKEIQIPLPPLSTQKRIAEILDAADALRRKDQELLKKYDELAQAIFIDMFGDPVKNEKGWEKVKLSHFIARLETGVSVNSNDDIFSGDKKCVLKTSCVYTGYFSDNEAKVISPSDLVRAKLNPVRDSIIISRMNTRELVGMSAYIEKDYPNLFLPDRLWMTVKSDNPHSSLWLSFALKSFAIREQIQKIASGTSGSMKNISKKDFLEIEVINPPCKLQRTFEDALKKINELKKKSEINNEDILFNSLIQKAFNGELVS